MDYNFTCLSSTGELRKHDRILSPREGYKVKVRKVWTIYKTIANLQPTPVEISACQQTENDKKDLTLALYHPPTHFQLRRIIFYVEKLTGRRCGQTPVESWPQTRRLRSHCRHIPLRTLRKQIFGTKIQ